MYQNILIKFKAVIKIFYFKMYLNKIEFNTNINSKMIQILEF